MSINNTTNNKNITKTYDLGSYVQDISISPYMRARPVAFIATGLRPNTVIYAYFDNQPVSQYCAPGIINISVYDPNTGEFTVDQGKEDQVVARTGEFGQPLVSDEFGNLAGIFNLPDQMFRVGDRSFILIDVDDLSLGEDAILTQAKAVYTASSIGITYKDVNITTIQSVSSQDPVKNVIVDKPSNINRKNTNSSNYGVILLGSRAGWEAADAAASANQIVGGWSGGGGGTVLVCRMGDPIAQSFYVNVPENVPGAFIEAIGVYFRSKDPNLGITCYITELNSGVPDTSKIVASSYLKPSAVSTSNDGSTETIFKFQDIPYMSKEKGYAFFLRPDGDSPEYTIWMSELGQTDILTGNQIYTNPYIGVAFRSSNSNTWDPLQTEDIKFNVYRCKFNVDSPAAIELSEQEDEYITTNGFSYSNSSVRIQPGDIVYTVDGNSSPIIGGGSPTGVIQAIYWSDDKIVLDSSSGGFVSNTNIGIFRPTDPSNPTTYNANTRIATSTISEITDVNYSIVVPRVSSNTPTGTNVVFEYKGMDSGDNVDNNWIGVQPEIELEFTDKSRVVRSKSNRLSPNSKSVGLKTHLFSASNFVSPTVDLRRKNIFAIKNLVNNDLTDENTRNGTALSKYVSVPITLAEGQDAEDVRVILSAYRPTGTEISVYVKALCADDPDTFYNKMWTKLDMIEGQGSRSSDINTDDYREYTYAFPTAEEMQGTAWCNSSNDYIVQYRNADGAIFVGYKQFAVKFVLTAEQEHRVPRVADVRAICLQI